MNKICIIKSGKIFIKSNSTLISISSIRWAARIIGRPTTDGNVYFGKFEPAKPHLTNF